MKWRLFPGLIETRPLSPPPPPCIGVSSNRDWLPAPPPWGSSNKDQLPNLIETKGCRRRGFLPFRSSLPAAPFAFLLPAEPGSEVGGGRSTSLAFEAWQGVSPEDPSSQRLPSPGPGLCICPAAVVPRKDRPRCLAHPRCFPGRLTCAALLPPQLLPTLKSPLEENVK